jgi:hypothetical protein
MTPSQRIAYSRLGFGQPIDKETERLHLIYALAFLPDKVHITIESTQDVFPELPTLVIEPDLLRELAREYLRAKGINIEPNLTSVR